MVKHLGLQPLEEKSTSSELAEQSISCHTTLTKTILHAPKRLAQAYELGESDARKLIEIYDKKKEENGTTTSESITTTSAICRESTMKVQDCYDNHVTELLGDSLHSTMKHKILNKNKIYYDKAQCTETAKGYIIEANDDCFGARPIKLRAETKLNRSEHKLGISRVEVSTQHSSVFNSVSIEEPERRSIEIQHSEKDLVVEKLRARSEVSIQCSLKLRHSDQAISTSSCEDVKETLRENRLRKVIRKLIYHQRLKTGDSAWQEYINDLKAKHKKNIIGDSKNVIATNLSVLNTLFQTSSTRRNQSNFIEESYGPSTSADNKHRFIDYGTSRSVSPLSEFTHTSMTTRKGSFSKFKISYPPSNTEYDNAKINSLCFPTFMANDVIPQPKEISTSKKLCRNIYNLPKSHNIHGNESVNFSRRKKVFDYLNQLRDLSINEMHTINKDSPDEIEAETTERLENPSIASIPPDAKKVTEVLNDEKINLQTKTSETKKVNCESEKINKVEKEVTETKTSLCEIENKLDKLIESIHFLMEEVKKSRSSEKNDKTKSFTSSMNKLDPDLKFLNKIIKTKSVPLSTSNGENILQSVGHMLVSKEIDLKGILSPGNRKSCEIKFVVSSRTDTKSTNTILSQPLYPQRDDCNEMKIMKKNKSKNHHVTCDEYPHAVQITVDFLVKDSKEAMINTHTVQRNLDCNKQCLIANSSINTEPLSLHQISKETLRTILSFFPIIEYYWNFLPFPKIHSGNRTELECDVCKRTFSTTVDLNRHRQAHASGSHNAACFLCQEPLRAKDTRTVKAVLPMPKLFSCQYCGQTFMRAYSKQLHEQNCPENKQRSLEKRSLIVLR